MCATPDTATGDAELSTLLLSTLSSRVEDDTLKMRPSLELGALPPVPRDPLSCLPAAAFDSASVSPSITLSRPLPCRTCSHLLPAAVPVRALSVRERATCDSSCRALEVRRLAGWSGIAAYRKDGLSCKAPAGPELALGRDAASDDCPSGGPMDPASAPLLHNVKTLPQHQLVWQDACFIESQQKADWCPAKCCRPGLHVCQREPWLLSVALCNAPPSIWLSALQGRHEQHAGGTSIQQLSRPGEQLHTGPFEEQGRELLTKAAVCRQQRTFAKR
jgi:hypothetical protein